MIAAVAIWTPLVGELEISLPPCVVPTLAEAALANVGVRFTVAPYSGFVEEALMESVGSNTTVTVVVADFEPSSFEVAVIVKVPLPAGAVQTPDPAFIVPPLADHVMPLVTPPTAVVVNVGVLFTLTVEFAGLIALTTTVCGVTVTELSA